MPNHGVQTPETFADLERRLEALEGRLESEAQQRTAEVGSRVEKIELWIKVALGLALVFGIGGAWGYTVISSVEAKVSGVEETLTKVESQAAALGSTFSDLQQQKLPQLERSLQQLKLDTVTVNSQAEVVAARMGEQAAQQLNRLDREASATGRDVEVRWREAEDKVKERAESALQQVQREREQADLQLAEARKAALGAIEGQVREVLRRTTATWTWKDCAHEMVGPERTHRVGTDEATWCPPGKFLVQLNFDTRGWNKELFVREVLCCAQGVELGGGAPARAATQAAATTSPPR
ncbi:MAG TPA: hypothetical protein VF017_17875 [Thermoanaerobaculia bacterium]|nr:hypothetical protein [Thermoanaerobaculia bacterium]